MGKLNNKTTRSQCDKLLEHFKENKSLTTYDAVHILRIYRISARIADLRRRGHLIDTIVHHDIEDGMPKVWGEYIYRGIA